MSDEKPGSGAHQALPQPTAEAAPQASASQSTDTGSIRISGSLVTGVAKAIGALILGGGGIGAAHLSMGAKVEQVGAQVSETQRKVEGYGTKLDSILADLAVMKERDAEGLRQDLPKRTSQLEARMSALEARAQDRSEKR